MKRTSRCTLLSSLVVIALAACEAPPAGPGTGSDAPGVSAVSFVIAPGEVIARPNSADDLGEKFIVCKTGPTATFDVWEITSDGPVHLRDFSVEDGTCVLAAAFGQTTREIMVEETVPDDAELVSVEKTQLTCKLEQTHCGGVKVITGPAAATNPVSGFIGGSAGAMGLSGVLADFVNRVIPEGGDGCTPGYWKNHTGLKRQTNQWPPTGHGQGDGYDATFGVDSNFGGSLLEALNRGGGGENALGRHAVAALLNAAHPDVSFDLSEAEVIAAVAGAYGSGDFETAKDELAAFNEQGCPIGN